MVLATSLSRRGVTDPQDLGPRKSGRERPAEVFGLLALSSFPPSPPWTGDWMLGIRGQLPQRDCSGFSPDSMQRTAPIVGVLVADCVPTARPMFPGGHSRHGRGAAAGLREGRPVSRSRGSRRCSSSLPWGGGEELRGGLGAVAAIEGGGDDAAGKSGAFAGGEEAREVGVLEAARVPRDSHRRAGAGFKSDQQGVFGQ